MSYKSSNDLSIGSHLPGLPSTSLHRGFLLKYQKPTKSYFCGEIVRSEISEGFAREVRAILNTISTVVAAVLDKKTVSLFCTLLGVGRTHTRAAHGLWHFSRDLPRRTGLQSSSLSCSTPQSAIRCPNRPPFLKCFRPLLQHFNV